MHGACDGCKSHDAGGEPPKLFRGGWMNETSMRLHRKQVRFGSDDVASVQTAARLRTSKDLPQVRRGFKDEHQIQSMKHGLK